MAGDEAVGGDSDGFVCGDLACGAEQLSCGGVPVEDLFRIFLENDSGRCQGHRAAASGEKLRSHILFQFGNVLTHGWLGDAKSLRRDGEAAVFGHGHKDLQLEIL